MDKWDEEFKRLRAIALDCQLTEEMKWGCPCFTFQSRNIVLIHGFKDYCAYLFHRDDKRHICCIFQAQSGPRPGNRGSRNLSRAFLRAKDWMTNSSDFWAERI